MWPQVRQGDGPHNSICGYTLDKKLLWNVWVYRRNAFWRNKKVMSEEGKQQNSEATLCGTYLVQVGLWYDLFE